MIRETKVGIVIACSFIALVGVVLVNKLREEPPTTEPKPKAIPAEKAGWSAARKPAPKSPSSPVVMESPRKNLTWFAKVFDEPAASPPPTTLAMAQEPPPLPPPGSSEKKSSGTETPTLPPGLPVPGIKPVPDPTPGVRVSIPGVPPAPTGSPKEPLKKTEPPVKPEESTSIPGLPDVKVPPPPSAPGLPDVKGAPPPVSPPPAPGGDTVPPPAAVTPDLSTPSVPEAPVAPPAVPPVPVVPGPEKKKESPMPTPVKPVKKPTKEEAPPAPPTPEVPEVSGLRLKGPTPPPSVPVPPITPELKSPTDVLPPPVAPVRPEKPLDVTPVPVPPTAKEVPPSPPVPNEVAPPVKPRPTITVDPVPPPGSPVPPPSGPGRLKPEATGAPGPIPEAIKGAEKTTKEPPRSGGTAELSQPIPGKDEASQLGSGSRTTKGVNPAALPMSSTPYVVTFNEEEHVCKDGETYESIAKQKYMTDKYAEALRLYNRYDSMVPPDRAPSGANLRKGDVIMIPDLSALEARYARAISGYQALPEPTGIQARKTSSSATREYTVRGKGQTMREIARDALGDSDRWRELQKLNPRYVPNFEIPGGAVVLVPAK